MPQKNRLSYHQRIVNLLGDGEWHTFRDIHRAVARFINADLADKEYRKRHRAWASANPKARVAQGRKRLVLLSLLTLVHHRKLVEIGEGRNWERLYRMTREAMEARNTEGKARG
jgi:hypothetical protein